MAHKFIDTTIMHNYKFPNDTPILAVLRLNGEWEFTLGNEGPMVPEPRIHQQSIARLDVEAEAAAFFVALRSGCQDPTFVTPQLGLPHQSGYVVDLLQFRTFIVYRIAKCASTYVHYRALFVTQEHKIRIRHLGVLRQEVRFRVELPQFRQDHWITVTPSHVPRLVPGTEIFRHAKHVFQGLKVRFEMQKLAIFMEAVERWWMFVVEILEEGEIEQPGCRPMRYSIFDYDGPRRIGVRFELFPGQIGQDNWSLNACNAK